MKFGLVVIVNDLDKKNKIEALPIVFANQESIDVYCERRLNPLVTQVISVAKVEVPDTYDLFIWTRKELELYLKKEDENRVKFRVSK